jgi:N-acetylglutamate synthase-like GNAT family acetyltransferase
MAVLNRDCPLVNDIRLVMTHESEQRVVSTGTPSVRLAMVVEQKELEALQWRASLNNAGDREALLANPDAIELPVSQIESGLVFVAEKAGVTVGFAAVLPREDGQMELDALFVEPSMWRQGIGKVLLDRCVEAARTHGAVALHVVGNPHAEGFYRSCGFQQIGTIQTRFGPGLSFRLMIPLAGTPTS